MSVAKTFEPSASGIFITEDLARRAWHEADYLQEKRALQELASHMADGPEDVLPRFVDLAMEMTDGVSAGLSLYEGDEAFVFRWRYLRGILSPFEGATTPRDLSPCGVTLDRNEPVLAQHPERMYGWIADAGIAIPEVLLVPLYLGGDEPLGTLWIVAPKEGHFDAGHARAMTELAAFVGAALCILRSQQRLREALAEQESLAAEMDHRIKNLFAIAEGMIRASARTTSSKEEMAVALSGRLHALASAHALVRRDAQLTAERTADLADLIRALLSPHDVSMQRISLDGPAATCADKAVDSVALVIHELATNAVKYGALAAEEGRVHVSWRQEGDMLVLRWVERGGPPVEAAPQGGGYGSKLVHATVTRQFGGTIEHDWHRDGLTVTIAMPTGCLLRQDA